MATVKDSNLCAGKDSRPKARSATEDQCVTRFAPIQTDTPSYEDVRQSKAGRQCLAGARTELPQAEALAPDKA
jgi:hypothetical protein